VRAPSGPGVRWQRHGCAVQRGGEGRCPDLGAQPRCLPSPAYTAAASQEAPKPQTAPSATPIDRAAPQAGAWECWGRQQLCP